MTEAGRRYYAEYLHIDRLLSCQELASTEAGVVAHDEMLFMIVHQAYELWFKQILWELDAVIDRLGGERVDEKDMGQVVAHLERIREIQRLLIVQLDVLETMTPLDFLDFRDLLVPASGFQSVQLRLIENKLGLDPEHRLRIGGADYTAVLNDADTSLARAAESQPSLLTHVERWLERTPFLHLGEFDFWSAYQGAVQRMLDRDRHTIITHPTLDDAARAEQLESFEQTAATFGTLFDEAEFATLIRKGHRRLSQQAFLAALFISLYRDEPAFHMPFRLLTALVDIDQGFTTWRQRHALMAHRMIGGKIGTGGTSGHRYLQAAAERHRVFLDLFELPTFFIPRSELPSLPEAVIEQLQFRFGSPPP